MEINWKKIGGYVKEIVLGLPGNVLGNLAGDLVEEAVAGAQHLHQVNKFAEAIGEELEDFAGAPEGAKLLEAVSKNITPRQKRRFRHGDKARDIVKQAIDGIDGFSVKDWAKALLKNIELSEYSEQTQKKFFELLGTIQSAAVEYWKKFLHGESYAIVNLVARTVESGNAQLKEELLEELKNYFFTSSGAPMSAREGLKTRIFTCENCGETIDPKSLRPTETAGIYGCICPTCGRALSFGDFTKAGKEWSEECETKLDAVLDGIRSCNRNINKILEEIEADHRRLLKQIEARRQKLFEDTHAGNINESVVVDDAKRLLELVPDDILAQFYVFVAENNSEAIEYFLGRIDVVACGAEVVCTMLDYLVEPLEPRMKGALLSLNDRALTQNVFNRGQHTKYMTAIQQGSFFDSVTHYDLFIAYKSTDRAEVDALLRELEKQQLTCFVAYRDLPHGRGAGGTNYWTRLKLAMDHSRGIVFVSTPNSRSMECDAIRREDETVDGGEGELNYFEQFPRGEKVRIEYRPPCDRETETPRAIAKFLKRFFGDVEYCKTPEEVADCANEFLHPELHKGGETKKVPPMSEDVPSETQEETPPQVTPLSSFEIEDGILKKFVGTETAVVIPDGVTEIGNGAFSWCRGLTSIKIPDCVTSIKDEAFLGCSALKSIKIPDSVMEIGNKAFSWCSALKSIKIPYGVTSIGEGTFCLCRGLKNIKIPDSVTSIGDMAFMGCFGLKGIKIPDGVTEIGKSAFFSCTNLVSIKIPDSVMEIGGGAFHFCERLESITIPNNSDILIALIWVLPFIGCDSLKKVYVRGSKEAWKEIEIALGKEVLPGVKIYFRRRFLFRK